LIAVQTAVAAVPVVVQTYKIKLTKSQYSVGRTPGDAAVPSTTPLGEPEPTFLMLKLAKSDAETGSSVHI